MCYTDWTLHLKQIFFICFTLFRVKMIEATKIIQIAFNL